MRGQSEGAILSVWPVQQQFDMCEFENLKMKSGCCSDGGSNREWSCGDMDVDVEWRVGWWMVGIAEVELLCCVSGVFAQLRDTGQTRKYCSCGSAGHV